MRIKGSDAFAGAKGNPERAMSKWVTEFDGLAKIHHRPKFTFGRESKFFTIGSCFARNVENWLRSNGVTLLSEVRSIPGDFYEIGGKERAGYQNVYTPGSVLEAVRLCRQSDIYHSIAGSDDAAFDLLTSGLKPLLKEEAIKIRQGLVECYQRLASADVVVVTLGYNESWVYAPSGAYINRAPSHPSLRKKIEDFEFEIMGYEQSLAVVVAAIEEISRVVCEAKIVVTVSPVPLGSTFSANSVVVANQLSKAVLRSVAGEVSLRYENVDCFPSYEMVVNSRRDLAFEVDGIHVKKEVVAEVMRSFSRAYFQQ
jgi:hypothetical protein